MIQQLIDKKFDRFATIPFGPSNDTMHITWSMTYPDYPKYIVVTGIQLQDDLDVLIQKKLQTVDISLSLSSPFSSFSADTFILSDEEIKQLQHVYLFKSQQDLEDLWYVVSSYRTRTNNDAAWRKDNISISYRNIGNVRVLNMQQTFSFMDEVHKEPGDWKRYFVDGRAIMWWLARVVGWGICGAARGINTVILPNKAFEVITRYNHTRTYKNMYDNDINGQNFWIPWLDVAVYRMGGSTKDFVFKNIREYPIILVMNYDGTPGWMEELFVLGHENDRWTLKYIGKKGNCYTWEANDVPFKSCYNAVSWW